MDLLQKELKQLEKRKKKARSANDLAEEAKLYNLAGMLLSEHSGHRRGWQSTGPQGPQGLFAEAIEQHMQELHLSECMNDTIAVAIAHRKIGECLCECKDFKNALVHQQKYLELSRKCKDLVEEQRAFATIGRTWFQSAESSSDMMKAQSAYLESLAICDQLGEIVKDKELLEMRARLYLNLGLVRKNLNEKNGIKYIEKSLGIAVSQSLKDTEYRCHFSLGEIKVKEGRPAEALQSFERARKVAQHQRKKYDEADTLVQIGQVLLNLGDFKGSKSILKKCYKAMRHGNYVEELRSSLIKAIKGTQLLDTLKNCTKEEVLVKIFEDLGDLFSKVKCYQSAIHYYLKQYELAEKMNKPHKEKAAICVSLAMSYSDNKQYDKAKEYYLKELGLRDGEPDEQCDTWCNIANVGEASGSRYEEVEEAYQNALLCTQGSQNPNRKIRVLKLLAETQKKFSRDREHEETLREISTLGDCKLEDDSDDIEESQVEDEDEDDDEEGNRLIEEELRFSDRESDEEETEKRTTGTARRTNAKSINKRNEKGETILHCAAIKGDFNLAKTSIEKGVSVHSRDYCGWQPLHEACNHGHIRIVELLLDSGADISDPGGPHCRGMTPLHDATQNGNVDVVKLLLSRGASVTKKNKDGQTPLDQVLDAIAADEEDPDDDDPELSEIRKELKNVLTNAMRSTKKDTNRLPEVKRRDLMNILYESNEVSAKPSDVSTKQDGRKRKNTPVDLDSEDDSDDVHAVSEKFKNQLPRNRAVLVQIGESDSESQDEEHAPMSDSESQDRSIPCKGPGDLVEGDFSEPTESLSELSEDRNYSQDLELLDPPDPYQLVSSDRHSVRSLVQFSPRTSKASSSSFSRCKTNRSSVRHFRQTSLKNGIANTTNSSAFLDPLTGSTGLEHQASDSPALIPENEYLEGVAAADGWLIDDMPKKAGKRKRPSDTRSMLSSSEMPTRTPQVSSPRNRITKRTGSSVGLGSHQDSRSPNLKQSRLSSHVVSGHSREESWYNEAPASYNQGSSLVKNRGAAVGNNAPELPAPMRLRVKVKEETFLIPCPSGMSEKKTVQWLAEQAQLRYYTTCGLKPILSLSTTEGASLSPDDQIADLLSSNEQVIASVRSWDLPPLAERYEAACRSAETGVHRKIQEVFQSNPQMATIEFSDMALTPMKFLPLFRALQCHEQLVKLSLPGNRMGDSGFQHFVSALPCLPNLAIIILSSNGISHKGLRNLASTLNQNSKCSQTWMGLKELDLSFNPLSDISASSLATVLRSCSHLQILNIKSCYLTEATFQPRSVAVEALSVLTRLRHFKISDNMIFGTGLRPLLRALTCCHLELLDVSYTTKKYDPDFGQSLAEYLDLHSSCIQELVCQGCFLRDRDVASLVGNNSFRETMVKLDLSINEFGREGVTKLADAVKSSKCLKCLNLTGNTKATNDSVSQFIAPSPIGFLQHLDLSVCGLTSPLPINYDDLRTSTHSRNLKFLNLSHNSIQEDDKDKLSEWWTKMWGEDSRTCRNPPFMLLTVNQSAD